MTLKLEVAAATTLQKNAVMFPAKHPIISSNLWEDKVDTTKCSYLGLSGDIDVDPYKRKLVNLVTGTPAKPIERHLHSMLRGMCYHDSYPCHGTIPVFRYGNERVAVFDSMDRCNIEEVCYVLCKFYMEYLAGEPGNELTFFLMFSELKNWKRKKFRREFWILLKKIAKMQAEYFGYAEGYSPVLNDSNFSFSFAGVSTFIAAFFNDSPRVSRRFGYTTLVFNIREQFNKLKAEGKFEAFKSAVKKREEKVQNNFNTNLSDFGSESEWRQYDSIDTQSACPFHRALQGNWFSRLLNTPPIKSLI
jgi:uncharacterized protein